MGLIVVSNRLPIVLRSRSDGGVDVEPGSGGLVTALRPVLQNRRGVWVGWPGAGAPEPAETLRLLKAAEHDAGYELIPVTMSREEHRGFYQAFSNEAIWPLFHDLPSLTRFRGDAWSIAERVNRRFAEAVATRARHDDFVWVHDYHLIGAANAMREAGISGPLGFFLHIPFPPLDMFLKLPWRSEVLNSLLGYDLVGFQTMRDRRNFLQCVRELVPDATVQGKGAVVTVSCSGRVVRVGAFPIGIDFDEFASGARADGVARKVASIRADEPHRRIVLSVDRLDYTKGLPLRLAAIERLLETEPGLRGRVTFIQFVVPSRESIPRYAEQKQEIERMVGEINGRFTRSGWVPIRHNFRSLPRPKLLAYYRAADAMLVTPVKDGMNLVAKEFCAAHIDGDGALVLSEFAGAAAQLQHGAILINPWDASGTAAAIAKALRMPSEERRTRMRKLRRAVREHDIYDWVDAFLRAAIARNLGDFPRIDDFLPSIEVLDAVPAD